MAKEYVILLHGLLRNSSSMNKMASSLESLGYICINHDYPSSKANIKTLADNEITKALSLCPKEAKVHFVTHSLGGILLRQFLSEHQIPNLGRVLMLGPPNKGSQIVDRLKKFPGFKLLNGPASIQLGTDESSIASSLGAVDFDLGIIAGTKTFDFLGSLMLPGANDGKVSVENTKVEGMSAHLVLEVTHTFMMKNKKVIHQVAHFLKEGTFDRL